MGVEEDESDPHVALFGFIPTPATTLCVQTEHVCPPVVLTSTATPSSLVWIVKEED